MISKMLFLIHLNLFGLKKLLLMFDLVTNIVVTFDLLPQFDVSSKKITLEIHCNFLNLKKKNKS
jgi:hypothetical protein